MGWLITLGIITLLAVLPLGVSFRYDEGGVVLRLIIGPVKITLIPRPEKDKKPKKQKKPRKQETKQDPAPAQPNPAPEQQKPAPDPQPADENKPGKKSGGPLKDFLPLLRIVLDMLGAFRRRLRVNIFQLKLIMAAEDPCDLAVNYGRAWTAVGNLLPQLEKIFVIKKRDVEVECDFTAAQTLVIARLDLTITLGRLLATAVVYGIRALMEFLKINKKRKGGASK